MFILNSARHEKKSRKLSGKVHVFPCMLFRTEENAYDMMESQIDSLLKTFRKMKITAHISKPEPGIVYVESDTDITTYRITEDDPED